MEKAKTKTGETGPADKASAASFFTLTVHFALMVLFKGFFVVKHLLRICLDKLIQGFVWVGEGCVLLPVVTVKLLVDFAHSGNRGMLYNFPLWG